MQQNLQFRLYDRVKHLRDAGVLNSTTSTILHVKLSGDGTRVGRKLHLVNITFTLLNEGPLATKRYRHKYTLAQISRPCCNYHSWQLELLTDSIN